MQVILTILAVALTVFIGLVQARLTGKAVLFIVLGWWVVLTVISAIWVLPDGCIGAVEALIAAAWFYTAQRMDCTTHPDRAPSPQYAWSSVGLIVVIAGVAVVDVAVLAQPVPAGMLWRESAFYLTLTGDSITHAVLQVSRR